MAATRKTPASHEGLKSPIQQIESTIGNFASTPAQANSSRKRQKSTDLERATASPGHQEKMRSIFRGMANQILPAPRPRLCREHLLSISESAQPVQSGLEQHEAYIKYTPQDIPAVLNGFQTGSEDLSSDSMSWASDAQLPLMNAPGRLGQQSPRPHLPRHDRLVEYFQGERIDSNTVPATPNREPLSSGFNSPSNQPCQPHPVTRADLMGFGLGYADGPDDEDMHSTHGVPLIMPIVPVMSIEEADVDRRRKNAHVHAWLDQTPNPLLNGVTDSPDSLGGNESDKNKENIPPYIKKTPVMPPYMNGQASSHGSKSLSQSTSPHSPLQPLAERPIILPRLRPRLNNSATGGVPMVRTPQSRPRPGTPRGIFSLPSHRKRLPHLKGKKPDSSDEKKGPLRQTEKMPTIRDEDAKMEGENEEDELAELSPSVARFRKGKGPKVKERCASYFDEDILPELAKRK